MMEPLNLNHCSELGALEKMDLKDQYLLVMEVHKLSVSLNENKVESKEQKLILDEFGSIKQRIISHWDILK